VVRIKRFKPTPVLLVRTNLQYLVVRQVAQPLGAHAGLAQGFFPGNVKHLLFFTGKVDESLQRNG
jgi:hypothetical protein